MEYRVLQTKLAFSDQQIYNFNLFCWISQVMADLFSFLTDDGHCPSKYLAKDSIAHIKFILKNGPFKKMGLLKMGLILNGICAHRKKTSLWGVRDEKVPD